MNFWLRLVFLYAVGILIMNVLCAVAIEIGEYEIAYIHCGLNGILSVLIMFFCACAMEHIGGDK